MSKAQHGGRREPPGGRPRQFENGTAKKTITLTPDDLAFLLAIDSNVSQAIRTLITRARSKETSP